MKRIDFNPIPNLHPGSYIALSIRPPGTWFEKNDFRIFVGGSGRGARKTLAAAKTYLLAEAIRECDRHITAARNELDHYMEQRLSLVDHGLGTAREVES